MLTSWSLEQYESARKRLSVSCPAHLCLYVLRLVEVYREAHLGILHEVEAVAWVHLVDNSHENLEDQVAIEVTNEGALTLDLIRSESGNMDVRCEQIIVVVVYPSVSVLDVGNQNVVKVVRLVDSLVKR